MDSDEMIQARREALNEEARGYRLRLARAEATGDDQVAAEMRDRLDHVAAARGDRKPDEPVQRRPRRAAEKRA